MAQGVKGRRKEERTERRREGARKSGNHEEGTVCISQASCKLYLLANHDCFCFLSSFVSLKLALTYCLLKIYSRMACFKFILFCMTCIEAHPRDLFEDGREGIQ